MSSAPRAPTTSTTATGSSPSPRQRNHHHQGRQPRQRKARKPLPEHRDHLTCGTPLVITPHGPAAPSHVIDLAARARSTGPHHASQVPLTKEDPRRGPDASVPESRNPGQPSASPGPCASTCIWDGPSVAAADCTVLAPLPGRYWLLTTGYFLLKHRTQDPPPRIHQRPGGRRRLAHLRVVHAHPVLAHSASPGTAPRPSRASTPPCPWRFVVASDRHAGRQTRLRIQVTSNFECCPNRLTTRCAICSAAPMFKPGSSSWNSSPPVTAPRSPLAARLA